MYIPSFTKSTTTKISISQVYTFYACKLGAMKINRFGRAEILYAAQIN
jgi:hypothetical protein